MQRQLAVGQGNTRPSVSFCFLVATALLGVVGSVCAAPAPVHTLAQAPASLVTAVTQTLAARAASDPAYAIGANGCATLPARGKGNALSACFGRRGARFSSATAHLGLHLTAFGRSGHLHAVHLRRGAPHANRIAYRAPGLREWWRALPLGYEQGFTLSKAPAGHGEVVLQLTASATPHAHHGTLAWGKLRYGKLEVIDATGHVLPAHLTSHGRTIDLAFAAAHAQFPVTVDPTVWNQQELTASDGAAYDSFGISVALSADGTTALVGADGKNVGTNKGQGAAYVYTYSATTGTWTQAAELTASDGAAYDAFGASVALSSDGTIALVGAFCAPYSGSSCGPGAAYVYTEPASGGWATTSHYAAELTATGGVAKDQFGYSVALSSDGATALVGAYGKTVGTNSGQGSAYVYTEPSGGWSSGTPTQTELTASNGVTNDSFGSSVALSSDGATALVGAEGKTVGSNSGQGAAYVYAEPSGGWSSGTPTQTELTASDGAAYDAFGYSVALSSDGATALVGAYGKTVGTNSGQGSAYVYAEPSGGWATTSTYAAELTASDGAADDYFGQSVALSSDGATALVGNETNSSPGSAYVYAEPSGGWSSGTPAQTELTATGGATDNYFGNSVALSSDGATALVGASNTTVGTNTGQGSAYLLTDTDLSTVLNAPSSVTTSSPYTVDDIVTNSGADSSADLTVDLPVPSGTSYDSISATQGTCSYDSATQIASCDLGRLAGSGTDATAQLKLTPTASSGSITQTASVYGSPTLAQSAASTVTATSSSTPTSGGSGSSSGGGGAIGLWALLALAGLSFVQHRRRR